MAENVKEAEELIKWYRSEINGPTWCIAENWRFLESHRYARDEIKGLGRILGFQGRQQGLVVKTGKFYRKFASLHRRPPD